MRGVLLLSWKHLCFHRARSLILIASIAVSFFLPLLTRALVERYQTVLRSRAKESPLVAGAKGNRFDLTLATLYFRDSELETIPFSEYEKIRDAGFGVAIPLNLRFKARGYPIVACGAEYFEKRGLGCDRGHLPFRIGQCVLGATVAEDLDLGPGDYLFSDQPELYDITKPPALKMSVLGTLARSGGPDDGAVFVGIKTAWILEGIAHGHRGDEEIDPKLILSEDDNNVAISAAMVEHNEVTDENIASFHYHGSTEGLPLSSVLVFPRDEKSRTLVKARLNASRLYQMVVPTDVVEDLLSFVFKIKALLDLVAAILAATTLLLIVLVLMLSLKMRAREIEALNRIGCSRFRVLQLYAVEIAILVAASAALAAAAMMLTLSFLPDLTRAL
ncbi:MAG: hypothetical protein V3W41_12355 [Planctomycetota bacterium]